MPDVRGLFQGSGTFTQSGCTNPANNGTAAATLSINITTQSGENFSGSGTAVVGNTTDTLNLTGTVNASVGNTGSLTFNRFLDGFFAGSGNGSFPGQVSGNTLP